MPRECIIHDLIELRRSEWLDQVAIGSDPYAGRSFLGVVVRGDHHDRDQVRLAIALQPVAEIEPVNVGQRQVDEDQVGLGRLTSSSASSPE